MDLSLDVWEPNKNELKRHPGYVPVEGDYDSRPNVIGVKRGVGEGRSLLLNGHVDVIPPGSHDAWKHSPWSGKIEGGRIHGRGASDMKSGLAAMTMALNAILKTGIDLAGDVILEYTVDEELSGNGTLACILRGYSADAGISCETSSLRVQPASIGRIWFEILVRGRSAGIQRRWEGVNAIAKGYKIVEAVSHLEDLRVAQLKHPLYPDKREALPCLVCVFQGGSYPSAFPDMCLLKGSLATLPGEDSENVKKRFVEYIESVSEEDEWLVDHPPDVVFKGYFAEPSEISPEHPIVKTLAGNFYELTRREPVISGRLGAADTRFLNRYGNTPTVIFGPGETEQMHSVNESVSIDDLMTATKALALTILDWCGHV
jgi:acetylornithine deacetylase